MSTQQSYLLDTSALAKRYHQEKGREYVQYLFTLPECAFLISDLTVIEMHSLFAKKVRTGEITLPECTRILEHFHNDGVASLFTIIRVAGGHKRLAIELLDKHAPTRGLRTLDALQLTVAVDLKEQERLHYFVTADARFGKVAESEGITVLNPEAEDISELSQTTDYN